MSDFNQNNSGKRTGGDRFRGERTGERRFDRRDTGRSEMFPATCDECKKSCQVPFRPTNGKPVYCSDCFGNKGGRSNERFDRRDSGKRGFGGSFSGRSDMHQAVCDQCGKNCEVPFRPTPGKPIYCSECFETKEKGKSHFGKSNGSDNYPKLKEQFDILNAKLDKILNTLKPAAITESPPKENISVKIEKTKETKPKKEAKKTTPKKKKTEIESEVKII